jgi:hypothetical protein
MGASKQNEGYHKMSNVASPREVRAFLLQNQGSLPEGVTVGQRGRLSKEAKAYFTSQTGQEVVSPARANDEDSAE